MGVGKKNHQIYFMIHNFASTYIFESKINVQTSPGTFEPGDDINQYISGAEKNSDIEGGKISVGVEVDKSEPIDSYEALHPGFRYLDKALKEYWGDIRIPIGRNTEKFRFMRVKVAGAQRGIGIWTDDLKNGRTKLPVAALNRTGHTFNPAKYTPAYNAAFRQFTSPRRDRMKLFYRPTPYIVDYSLSIWSETKTDAEYALYQIMTRFNPLAELNVSDGHWTSAVQLESSGITDDSEKEGGSDSYAKILYNISFKAEAWLSLPEQIAPTILGVVRCGTEGVYKIEGPFK